MASDAFSILGRPRELPPVLRFGRRVLSLDEDTAPVIGQEEWWDIVHLSRPKQWKSALRPLPLFCLTAAHKLDKSSTG